MNKNESTKPTIIIDNSRGMSEIKDESVHLVHPPLRVRGGKGVLPKKYEIYT